MKDQRTEENVKNEEESSVKHKEEERGNYAESDKKDKLKLF